MKRYRLPLIAAALVAVALVATVLVIDSRKTPTPRPAAIEVPTESPSPSESPSPPPPSPDPEPSPEPSDTEERGPGLPSCYKHVGTDATPVQVRNTLAAAARKQYWTTTKGITVPTVLMKAIAWQKSRWKSSIVACDGSVGVMQVSPKTAAWLNERFTVEYDVHTLKGNAALGAEYLEWLIKHYGETNFASSPHPYDVLRNKGMLDMVVAAYSAGASEVDGRPLAALPNPELVAQVKELMATCVCLKY